MAVCLHEDTHTLVHILQYHSPPQVMNNVMQHYCVGPLFLDTGCLLQYVVPTLYVPVIGRGTWPLWVVLLSSALTAHVYTSTSSRWTPQTLPSESELLWITTVVGGGGGWIDCDDSAVGQAGSLDAGFGLHLMHAGLLQKSVILLHFGATRDSQSFHVPSAFPEFLHERKEMKRGSITAVVIWVRAPVQGSVMYPCTS